LLDVQPGFETDGRSGVGLGERQKDFLMVNFIPLLVRFIPLFFGFFPLFPGVAEFVI